MRFSVTDRVIERLLERNGLLVLVLLALLFAFRDWDPNVLSVLCVLKINLSRIHGRIANQRLSGYLNELVPPVEHGRVAEAVRPVRLRVLDGGDRPVQEDEPVVEICLIRSLC